MKNYELITHLSNLPAGADVVINSSVWDQNSNELARSEDGFLFGDIDCDENTIRISGPAIDLVINDNAVEYAEMQADLVRYWNVAEEARRMLDGEVVSDSENLLRRLVSIDPTYPVREVAS